ncbi:DUF6064 family protein [Halanaerobium sp. ST460_2HS_T2]|uniref:DUF6064 family protein n=1 Tax=Halanaerobium sp. ST460_2HS_T2 TaxID=2183914 RepID=UPI000DF30D44|nr:DUF6064 family protein [Halanaerobium sp. ST460_2HS_T2]RCW52113.1 hypothetical protein DFR80_13625 [Halanaerobium sp. ST460_2HS_T2]
MSLPFAVRDFMNVFKIYNQSIWPMQIVFYLLGFLILLFLKKEKNSSNKIIMGILSFYWLWIGVFYHLTNFSDINKMAYAFGALFILEALIILYAGLIKEYISFNLNFDRYAIIGSIFIIYSMLIYPLIGYFLGHGYPFSPGFGVAPCPTAIFTFGVLLFANKIRTKHLIWIPLIWSIIGTFAAVNLNIMEDYGLFIAGITGTLMFLSKYKIMKDEEFEK